MTKVKKWESMGTHWKVEVWDEIGDLEFENLMSEIIKMSNDFDNKYSRFKPDSFVTQISKITGVVEIDEDFLEILKIYFKINNLTNGKINPCIGNTISDFGYDANYSLVKKEIIRLTPKFEDVVEILSTNSPLEKGGVGGILLKTFCLFDFGAIGKGYFVDMVVKFLKENNIKKFLVDASGDIYFHNVLDDEKYRCGLENPFNFEEVLGIVEIHNSALCSSSTNRRNWSMENNENLNHYIDPDKLKSVDEIISTFVVTKDTTTADALSSALFFVKPETLLKEYEFEYLVVNNNKQFSSNFLPGILF